MPLFLLGLSTGLGGSLLAALGIDNFFDSSEQDSAYKGLSSTVGYAVILIGGYLLLKKFKVIG